MTGYLKSRREDWPRSSTPGLDWARTDDGRVLVTLRLRSGGGGWTSAKPVTVSGCEPLFWHVDSPAFIAFASLSRQPQLLGGLCPADRETRNLLRAEVRRSLDGDIARSAIERACAGETAWLDENEEEEAAIAAEEE